MRIRSLIGILVATVMALPLVHGCSGGLSEEDGIVLETESFKLTLGKDAVARSLVVKGTNEEMLIEGANVPLFSSTQDRPFNNETKLQHPNTRTTYKADSLSWDGERLTVGFETAPYKAVVKVEKGAGYLRFILEDFICDLAKGSVSWSILNRKITTVSPWTSPLWPNSGSFSCLSKSAGITENG